MKTLVILSILEITIFCNHDLFSQVRDVQNKAASNQTRHNSQTSYFSNSENDAGYSIGGEFVSSLFFVFDRVEHQQRSVLERRFEEPWLVSLEMYLTGAYFTQYNNMAINPSAKLHWGMLSTDLRWFRMQDRTGIFETLDWQIIQINLLHKKEVRLYGGLGFSYEYFTESIYPEYGAGIDIHVYDRKINPQFMYRISKDYSTNATPRKELSGEILFRIIQLQNAELLLDLGLIYQRYYSGPEFYFLKTGMVIRILQRE